MKLIFHIGQQKAGSTALQNALYANRELLLQHGIFYPTPPLHEVNHGALASLIFEEKRWPRQLSNRERRTPGKMEQRAQVVLDSIDAAFKTKKFHTTILSSEYFFRSLNKYSSEGLKHYLLAQFEEVQFICYVRHPASRYLSGVLQKLRHSGRIPHPPKQSFRPIIQSYQEVAPVVVRAYDKDVLREGDIVKDFLHHFIPNMPPDSFIEAERSNNEALSAEVSSLIQQYRRIVHPDDDDVVYPEDKRLAHTLSRIAKEKGLTRSASLKPSLARYIEKQSRGELNWLEENYGIRFPLYDFQKEVTAPEDPLEIDLLRDVCEIDEQIERRLLLHAVHYLVSRSIEDERLIAHYRRPLIVRYIAAVKHYLKGLFK